MPFDAAAVQGLLFDLDGTLIDSTADLAASGNWLRHQQGLPDLDLPRIASYIGDGVEALVRRLLERPEGDVEQAVEAYKLHYHEHCLDKTRLHAGVAAALEVLQSRGYSLAVVTNKPERISRRILDGLGVGKRFSSVIGGNTCAHKKPHPEPLVTACGHMGCEPKRAVMVGDSRVDVEAGRNAGMPTVAILGGIGDAELLRAARPDVIVPGFADILDVLGE